MGHTPDVVISKPLKFMHDAFGFIGAFFLLVAVVIFLKGGNVFGAAVLSGIAFYISSKIKFKWVKELEVGQYRKV